MADIVQPAGRMYGAQVDDLQLRTQGMRQHIDGRSPGCKVLDHLASDRLGKGRYIFGGYAMVGRKNCNLHMIDIGMQCVLHRGQLDRDFLQAAECTGGFGQLRLVLES